MQPKGFQLFVPITKIDLERQEVVGIAAVEQLDKAEEIFDYETSKPYVTEWSDECVKRSEGKSLGNVRAMHGPVAAGKLVDLGLNDVAKQVEVRAHVVDDQEWRKCESGVYTGFSIGGQYVKRWKDPAVKGAYRYTAKPHEISLVDNPCMPGATFEALKADGTLEKRAFAPRPESSGSVLRKRVAILREAFASTTPPAITKSLYDAQTLASCLSTLDSLLVWAESEREGEGDGSTVPDDLRTQIRGLGDVLVAMVEEEVGELHANENTETDADVPLAMGAGLNKQGKRNSSTDQRGLQLMHDTAVALGADCATTKRAPAAPHATEGDMDEATLTKALGDQRVELEKAFGGIVEKVLGEKVPALLAPIEKAVGEQAAGLKKQGETLTALDARLTKIEAQPEPAKGVVVAPAKEGDGPAVRKDVSPDPKTASVEELTKFALRPENQIVISRQRPAA